MERRTFVSSAGVALGTALAGCPGSTEDSDTSNGAYSVSIEPMGEASFDAVPETWTALLPSYADTGFAFGAGQTEGIQLLYRYASRFYGELPGVEFDDDAVVTLNDDGVDKELFYEFDADVHFVEPNQLIHWYEWSEDDVAEIDDNVGPFFGNFVRRRRCSSARSATRRSSISTRT